MLFDLMPFKQNMFFSNDNTQSSRSRKFCLLSSYINDLSNHVLTAYMLQATARGFLIVLALSIHDFFEGIALGVETSTTATYFLLAAFASHKVVISGTVGLNWARSQVISNNLF